MDTSKATARPWVIHQSSRYRGDINMAWDIATEAATWDAKDYDEDEDTMGTWQFPADYRRIATTSDMGPEAKANAALIVRAVNSHDALVAALRDLLDGSEPWDVRATQARAALALAEQGGG